MEKILLEVCVGSVEDCLAAERAGADRLELNSALFLGGLTPTLGALIEAKSQVAIPIMAMIRPRAAGFEYSGADLAVMERDIDLALAHGADGVVFGVLDSEGKIDVSAMRRLTRRVTRGEIVFHRAFDVVSDPLAALETLIDLGIRRVMTSGQEETAYEGAALIARLIEHARGRIEILPAGRINRFSVADVVSRTGCNQVHVACLTKRADRSTSGNPHVYYGGALRPAEDRYETSDGDAIADLRRRLGCGANM